MHACWNYMIYTCNPTFYIAWRKRTVNRREASLSKRLVCSRIIDKKNLPTEWLYEKQQLSHLQTVLIVLYFLPHLTQAAFWCALNVAIFTTVTPISPWMVDCTVCTCQTTTLRLSRGLPPSIQCFRKCDGTSPLGLYLLYSLLNMTSCARALHAKRFSLAFFMRIMPCGIEAVAALHSIAVCCRNRGIRQDSQVPNFFPLQKSGRNAFTEWRMYEYIDSAGVVQTRWGSLRLAPNWLDIGAVSSESQAKSLLSSVRSCMLIVAAWQFQVKRTKEWRIILLYMYFWCMSQQRGTFQWHLL